MQKTKKKKMKSLLFCFIFISMTFFNMMQVTKVQSFSILEKKYTSPNNSDNSDNIFNLINSGSLTSQKQRILHNILDPYNLEINLGGFSTNLYLQWQDFQYICDNWGAMAPGWIDSRYQYKWLKGNGIKLSGTFSPMTSSPLEFYYNESFRSTRFAQMNSDLGDVTWIDFLSRITLGDEVPASSFNWCSFFSPSDQWPSDVIKYNQTYHDETGFWMKGLDVMNRSESFCFQNWIENRTATAMNLCYDWFKNKNSNWEVGWNTMAWTGLEPLLIKSDWRISGCYDTRFRDIYSQLRYYDVNFPNDKLIGLSWGNPYWEGGKDLVGADLESNFWAGYFAGADELIQFHYNWLNWDELSIKTWERLKKLYHTARSMPTWNASPTILELSDERGLPKPEAAGLVEYDVTTQLILNNTNFDLSKYRVIVIRDQMNIWDGIVEKLNQFVRTGGSIILVGRSLGWFNEYGEQRSNLFEFEQAGGGYNIAYEEYYSPFTLSFNGTNQLDLAWDWYYTGGRSTLNFTNDGDFTSIECNAPEETDYGQFPYITYKNSSNPESGYWFCAGIHTTPFDYTYTKPICAFFDNVIDHPEGIGREGWEKAIITTSHDPDYKFIDSYSDVEYVDSQIFSVGILNEYASTHERIDYYVNLTAHGAKNDTYFLYDGFNTNWDWIQTINVPENGIIHNSIYIEKDRAKIFHYTPVHPGPGLVISSYNPEKDPIVNEVIPLSFNFTNYRAYEDAFNCTLAIRFYNSSIHLLDEEDNQTYINNELSGQQSYLHTWWVKATQPGFYKADIMFNSDQLDQAINVTHFFYIWPGRLNIELSGDKYVVPGDSFHYDAEITYEGNETLDYVTTSEYFICMMYGNPGGLKNFTEIEPNSTLIHSDIINTDIINTDIGTTGMFSLTSSYNEDYWAEAYHSIGVTDVLLDIEPKFLPILDFPNTKIATGLFSETIKCNVSARGITPANNIKINCSLGNGEVKPEKEQNIRNINPNEYEYVSFKIRGHLGINEVVISVSAENVVESIQIRIRLSVWLLEPILLILLAAIIIVVVAILRKKGIKINIRLLKTVNEIKTDLIQTDQESDIAKSKKDIKKLDNKTNGDSS